MKSLIDNMHIGTRVITGFGLVLLCVAAVAVFSLFSLRISSNNLRLLNEATIGAIDAVDLERDVVDLHRNVQAFSFTGQASLAQSTESLIDTIRTKLQSLREKITVESELALVSRMQLHLETYEQTFQNAKEERNIRRSLVQGGIVNLRNEIESFFETQLLSETETQLLKSRFLDVERNLHKYLYDPNYGSVMRSLKELDTEIKMSATMPPRFRAAFAEYRKTVVRIVKATRGYLYLTGVVMAGEATEFSYASQQLKKQMLDRNQRIAFELQGSHTKLRSVTLFVSCFSVLIGVALSWYLGRGISKPIRSISQTFEKIVNGDRSANIPGQNRKDEIGILARAANVLKKQKRQTEELLDYSKTITNQLKFRTEDLERSNEELDQFVYTVSHDLKSPIVSAQGFLGIMREQIKNGEFEKALEKIPRIEKATARMSELISDLLDLNRIGRIDMEKEWVDVGEVMDELVASHDHQLQKMKIKVNIEGDLPNLFANRSRLRQVFENLIGNAIKYAGDQESPVIDVKYVETDQNVQFCIADNGPGIPPEFHEKIFALFQRIDQSNDGTGIGLSIVRKIMKTHDGAVWVDSNGNGDGCRFWLLFPKPEANSEPSKIASVSKPLVNPEYAHQI